MKAIAGSIALLFLAAPASASASAQASIEGRWTNPMRSVVVDVERCGTAYCGRVVQASAKAKPNARKGGAPNLIATRTLSGLERLGTGRYKGRVFVPKRNMY